ncbi:MAG TPA: crossover junction endodeoxyribonuclease RuvC [bacterium]|jgi:crossover junction endodeoxyribonuclease RuvC|nr:crossover junction endodeoxyribonuclease RuvC [bacterium]
MGLDPGYGRLGWAVVQENGSQWRLLAVGCTQTPASQPFEQRLLALKASVAELCARWRPEECSLETLYFSKNVKTAMRVAEARGVLRLGLAEAGVPVHEIAPNAVKLALTGHGSSPKAQVGRMVVRLLGLSETPKPDDAADAAAIALAGLRTRTLRKFSQGLADARGAKP